MLYELSVTVGREVLMVKLCRGVRARLVPENVKIMKALLGSFERSSVFFSWLTLSKCNRRGRLEFMHPAPTPPTPESEL